jgi:hypothetical protein
MRFHTPALLLPLLLSSACGDEVVGVDPTEGGGGAGEPSAAASGTGGAGPSGAGGVGGSAGGGLAGGGAGAGGDTGGAGGSQEPCGITPSGEPMPPDLQSPNDCHTVYCEDGALVPVNDDADLPADPEVDCLVPACDNGVATMLVTVGAACSNGWSVCDPSGICVECLSSADCVGSEYGPICDLSFQSCVECESSSDCVGNPAGEQCDLMFQECGECEDSADCPAGAPVCDHAQCVECAHAYQCPSAACGTPTCVDNACGLDPLPAGSTPIACYPYSCDGTSTDCDETCVSDADCQGQTCVDGACTASSPCDVEWYATHVPYCDASPGGGNSGSLVGIDALGSIYSTQHTTVAGGAVLWSLTRRAPAGNVLSAWSGGDGLHRSCSPVLGPMGGIGRNCSYSFQFVTEASFSALEYAWGASLFDGDGPPGAYGGATIDGANNVFFSASAGPSSLSNVHDIQGNLLPDTTAMVPTEPPQALPIGFDSTLLSQLASSDYVLDWAGEISLAGTATNAVDLGGGELAPIGTLDVIVAKFDATGQHLWSQRFEASGASAEVGARSFGLTDGSVIVTGDFTTADFGWGQLTQPGAGRFLAKLDPSGQPVCAKTISGTPVTGPLGEIVVARQGPVIVDGVSLGAVPSCGGVVYARLHP